MRRGIVIATTLFCFLLLAGCNNEPSPSERTTVETVEQYYTFMGEGNAEGMWSLYSENMKEQGSVEELKNSIKGIQSIEILSCESKGVESRVTIEFTLDFDETYRGVYNQDNYIICRLIHEDQGEGKAWYIDDWGV